MASFKKDSSYIHLMFNAISGSYDFINRVLSFGQDQKWRRKMALFLPNKKELFHLDIATGTGDQIFSLWESSSSLTYSIGIDPAEKMLQAAQKKLNQKSYLDKVDLLLAVAEQLPFSENTFDVATISFGIRNTTDPLQALKEMHRVIKDGGKALILEFSFPENSFLKRLHLIYLRYFLPKIGGFLSKHPSSYRYLNKTIEGFPYGKAFLSLMDQAGFQKNEAHSYSFGSVTLYVGEK